MVSCHNNTSRFTCIYFLALCRIKGTVFQHNIILLKTSIFQLSAPPISFIISVFGVRSATEPDCYELSQKKSVLAGMTPQSILVSMKSCSLKIYIWLK